MNPGIKGSSNVQREVEPGVRILFSDENLIIVDKPVNLMTNVIMPGWISLSLYVSESSVPIAKMIFANQIWLDIGFVLSFANIVIQRVPFSDCQNFLKQVKQ